jgi:hypothetical protein
MYLTGGALYARGAPCNTLHCIPRACIYREGCVCTPTALPVKHAVYIRCVSHRESCVNVWLFLSHTTALVARRACGSQGVGVVSHRAQQLSADGVRASDQLLTRPTVRTHPRHPSLSDNDNTCPASGRGSSRGADAKVESTTRGSARLLCTPNSPGRSPGLSLGGPSPYHQHPTISAIQHVWRLLGGVGIQCTYPARSVGDVEMFPDRGAEVRGLQYHERVFPPVRCIPCARV